MRYGYVTPCIEWAVRFAPENRSETSICKGLELSSELAILTAFGVSVPSAMGGGEKRSAPPNVNSAPESENADV